MELKIGVWYKIPKFNGYELLYDGVNYHVRSFKNFNKYKNGYELPYYHYIKKANRYGEYYEMTAYDNTRRRLKIHQILELMDNESYYATESNGRNISSRNLTLPHQRKDRVEKETGTKAQYYTLAELLTRKTHQ